MSSPFKKSIHSVEEEVMRRIGLVIKSEITKFTRQIMGTGRHETSPNEEHMARQTTANMDLEVSVLCPNNGQRGRVYLEVWIQVPPPGAQKVTES